MDPWIYLGLNVCDFCPPVSDASLVDAVDVDDFDAVPDGGGEGDVERSTDWFLDLHHNWTGGVGYPL